jgi:hypothetical protein
MPTATHSHRLREQKARLPGTAPVQMKAVIESDEDQRNRQTATVRPSGSATDRETLRVRADAACGVGVPVCSGDGRLVDATSAPAPRGSQDRWIGAGALVTPTDASEPQLVQREQSR